MTLKLKHPFTCIVAGPSGSGKTVFTKRLIKHANTMIDPAPERILWCYGIYQTFFNDIKNVEFHEGLPDLETFDGKHDDRVSPESVITRIFQLYISTFDT